MIIDSIDFSDLFDSIQASFAANIEKGRLNKILKQLTRNVGLLADANLKCYHYNMRTIAERKKLPVDHRLISNLDLEVRIINECRVKARARINSLLSSVYPHTEDKNVTSESWMTDDIVYSVGDMIDRLIIERIKVGDYEARQGRAGQVKQMREKIGNQTCGASE